MGVETGPVLVGAGMLQAIVYLLFIRAVDLYERESMLYVIPVFVWGFTVAVTLSILFNALFAFTVSTVADAQATNLLTSVVGAPVFEESSKGLALLLAFYVAYLASRRRGVIEFSGVMDGIVYGSAVGFGFAIAEDLIYYAQFGAETFVMRRVFGGFSHAAFTSLTGVGIGLIPWVGYRSLKYLLPAAGLAGAILLHGFFNLAATLFGPLAYVVLFFVVLLYVLLIIVWLGVERRTIRSELREEVSSGTISSDEYAILPTYFRRTGHYLRLVFSGRISSWQRSRKAHAAAIDLAFAKRLARGVRAAPQGERARRLREKIRDYRSPAERQAS